MKKVPLSRGQVALVDDDDFARVTARKWYALARPDGSYYAAVSSRSGHDYMHRFILGLPPGDSRQVDHINRDKLDNRRSNLRVATSAENNRNAIRRRSKSTTPYRGVQKRRRRWWASLSVNGKILRFGGFATPEAAAIAYDRAAITHHGSFAVTNASLGLLKGQQ